MTEAEVKAIGDKLIDVLKDVEVDAAFAVLAGVTGTLAIRVADGDPGEAMRLLKGVYDAAAAGITGIDLETFDTGAKH
jgi:hypothetical protein